MAKQDEIRKLEHEILKNKNLYYQGKPEISDFEYDKLEESLRAINPSSDVLSVVGSSHFVDEKIEHSKKMLSLNKSYKFEDISKWSEGREVLSTFKIDGSSCSLVYESGKLKLAKTRGDGRFGENITKKILFLDHLPKNLKKEISLEVRGEVYCTEENFILLSDKMNEMGLERPSSQRNIVAGLLGRKENIELCRYLSFQGFELFTEDLKFKTENEKFLELQNLGFETPEFYINKTDEDFKKRLDETKEFMSHGNYLIDGLVLSFNNLELHESMGETAHHPRYKMAFKFQGDTKETKINSISWQVSRNGYLTPVANIEPVELSGAIVGRVTLHNFGIVRQNNLKIGDTIEIVRSGEVIPKFLTVITESNNEFEFPTLCPSCKQETCIEEIRLICKNDLCPDKVKDEILNYIQKIGIDDLSSKRLEEMIKQGFITDIPSLYELTRDQLLSMDKVKEKLADKILNNIEKSKSADLITFLASLGISGGAYNKCEKLVQYGHDTIDKVLELRISQLELIESFAEKSATDFVNSFQSKKETVAKLRGYGFQFKAKLANINESVISGQKFCITGTLSMKRSELQKLVKENGGIVQSGVSKDTDYLITNDTESASSKFKKAQSLNIPIINEEKFFSIIGG
ncbi:MAG: DNA ligase (NAD+) [Bacteriovoracaceae bacterium]|jgi:DNA ligase (NAD+)